MSVVVTVDATAAAHVDEGLQSVRDQTHHRLEVVVVAVGEPGAAGEVVRRHARDDVRLRLRGSAPDQAAARNRGAAKAGGDYLLFVDVSDVLPPPNAVAALVTPLETSGSALAIGRRTEVRGLTRSVVQPPDPLHDEPRTGQTLDSCPVAVIDLGAENRMFRRSYWTSAHLAFTSGDPSGAELALHATASALGFDVVEEVTYIAMNRSPRIRGPAHDHMEGLGGWLRTSRTSGPLGSLGIAALRDQWAFAALDTWVQPLLDDAERASPDQWDRLRDYVRELTEGMSAEVWRWVRAEPGSSCGCCSTTVATSSPTWSPSAGSSRATGRPAWSTVRCTPSCPTTATRAWASPTRRS